MDSPTVLPKAPDSVPFSLGALATVLGDRRRWKIISELSKGEPMMVKEIAAVLGEPRPNVSSHMKVLLRAGIVRVGSGRLYHLADRFKSLVASGAIDFGFCVLRLEWIAAAKLK